ncbi:MAG: sugar transferase [Hyphomicrobiaceae bacterium]
MTVHARGVRLAYGPVKRLLDISLSLAFLVATSPVLLLASFAILRDDGRPVFFRQARAGLHGEPFEILKFRSMTKDAEAQGTHQTADSDPRVTGTGKWLRRTSIDELPQLYNVLKGDMSLVGPRPDTPLQRSNYTNEEWNRRCSVRPGITGLAQVLYKKTATQKTRTELDLEYVERQGFWFDLKVMGLTLWTVLRMKNA